MKFVHYVYFSVKVEQSQWPRPAFILRPRVVVFQHLMSSISQVFFIVNLYIL